MVVERFKGKSHRQWANLVIDYSEKEPDLEAIYNMPIRDLAEYFDQITNDEADDNSVDDEDECGALVIKDWLEEAAKVKEAYKQLCKDKKKKEEGRHPKVLHPKLPHTKLINKEKKESKPEDQGEVKPNKGRKGNNMNVWQKFLFVDRTNMTAKAYAQHAKDNKWDMSKPVKFKARNGGWEYKRLDRGQSEPAKYFWVKLGGVDIKDSN